MTTSTVEAPAPALPAPRLRWRGWARVALDLCLLALIAVGVVFRFGWTEWNQGADLHPDEYGLTSTLTQLRLPDSLADYFNTRLSPLSPYQKYDADGQPLPPGPDRPMPDNRMRWGQWPITIIRAVAEANDNTGYREMRLLGRRLSALFDTLTLGLAYLIGRRLYGHRAGLLAAALSALAVMQIQQSHFMTSDNFASFFSALAMYAAVRVAQSPASPRPSSMGASLSPLPASDTRLSPLPASDTRLSPLPASDTRLSPPPASDTRLSPPPASDTRPSPLPASDTRPSPLPASDAHPSPLPASGRGAGGVRSSSGPLIWYIVFGVAFGMAMASRINLLPLAGEIVLAAALAYSRDWTRAKADLGRIVADVAMPLALAGVVAVLTFRVTQPMSFRAETGDTTLFTLRPNPEWVESMKVAQAESSGVGGGPPGEQWTDRPAIVFPWVNMVVWGMGLPLGLTAWAGFGWAAWRAYRRNEWRLHLLPLTWAGGYFLFMGTRWVKSIRYFLPIYPFLALFAAWLIVEVWRVAGRRTGDRRPTTGEVPSPMSEVPSPKSQVGSEGSESDLRPPTSDLSPSSIVGRRSSVVGRRSSIVGLASVSLGVLVVAATLAWAWGFVDAVYRTDNTRIRASRWIFQNVPAPFNLHLQTADGGSYVEPIPLSDGTPVTAETVVRVPFQPRVTGQITRISVGHARNLSDAETIGRLRVVVAADPDGVRPLAEADLIVAPSGDSRGGASTAPLATALLEKGHTYYLLASAPEGGPLTVTGATLANESWDESLPSRLDGRDPFGGLYRGLTMEVRWADDENKRQMFLTNLEQVDYIVLPSQRAIWSTSRLPNTYPMTMAYYRALFDGRLGFDLVAKFNAPMRFGPLVVSDVAGAAAWGRPPDLPLFNDNLLAAEEAFSVYDHAPVWVFRKRADFDLGAAQRILNSVDLSTVVVQGPRDATAAPHLLMLPPDRLESQRAGGTWSELFDRESLVNRWRPVTIAVWWLTVVVLGWIAFPLAFAALPGLSDRGYPLAKVVGLLVVSWLAWMLASGAWLPFTRAALLLCLGLLALASAALAYWNRAALRDYLRAHRRYVVLVEALALGLFLFDLGIRFGNADLWHPNYGGEKPMDFAYLNAVLKSTTFPPYDPWFAGGYINYYYYGFVVVGALIKLLGVVPSVAYNLVLPTLFSCLGMGAFSVAYNLVAHRTPAPSAEMGGGGEGEAVSANEKRIDEWPMTASNSFVRASFVDSQPRERRVSLRQWFTVPAGPNPYLAGLMAALMIVVLGNLGEFHTLMKGLERTAESGGYPGVPSAIPGLTSFSKTLNGAYLVLTGQSTVRLGTGEWYWNATRIIPPAEGEAGPITEFPFFTFLYADLHAHMIALPITLLALAWAVSAVLGAKAGGQTRGSAPTAPRMDGQTQGSAPTAPRMDGQTQGSAPTPPRMDGQTQGSAPTPPRMDGQTQGSAPTASAAPVGGQTRGSAPTPPRMDGQTQGSAPTPPRMDGQTQGSAPPQGTQHVGVPLPNALAFWFVGGLAIGALRPTNTWDFPLYLGLGALAVGYAAWRRRPVLDVQTLGSAALRAGLVAALSLLLFYPYSQWYAQGYTSAEWWKGSKSTLESYLWIHGSFLFLLVTLLVRETRRWLAEVPAADPRRVREWMGSALVGGILLAAALAGAWLLGYHVTLVALPVALWAAVLALRPGQDDARRAVFAFTAIGLLLTLVVEGVVLKGDISRMNTVFKFYLQVWTLFSVSAAAALAWVWAEVPAWRPRWRAGWTVALGALLAMAGMYTVMAASAKMRDRFAPDSPRSLDGAATMRNAVYHDRDQALPLAEDLAAIEWLQENVPGSPVIVEAHIPEYRWGSRYSINTGLPAVLGWNWHQRQQRTAVPSKEAEVWQRAGEIEQFYSTADIAWAMDFVERYAVEYIVVGGLERAYYPAEGYPADGLQKFDRMVDAGMLERVYSLGQTALYRVVPAYAQH